MSAVPVNHAEFLTRITTFVLAGACTCSLMLYVAFVDSFGSLRLAAVLVGLLFLHIILVRRVMIGREARIYAAFVAYMVLQLTWTDDVSLALNTLVPAVSFLAILVLVGSLFAWHSAGAVIAGLFSGFVVGALIYTVSTGFPFRYPSPFSYNAVAMGYLFGLFATLIVAVRGGSRFVLPAVALVIVAHVVATTSIKGNLGIVAGAATAGLVYFGTTVRLMLRNLVLIVLLVAAVAYVAVTNEGVASNLERGSSRIALGIEVLKARDDVPGYGSFAKRDAWQREGLAGWTANPVFGNGVESFRARHGNTSHSTIVDLMHNSGLIGLLLFYSVLVSVLLRLRGSNSLAGRLEASVILATIACFAFISLSGVVHVNPFFAVILATSAGLAVIRARGPGQDRGRPATPVGGSESYGYVS